MRVRGVAGVRVVAVAAVVAVVAAACGSSKKSSSSTTATTAGGGGSVTTVKLASATINGSGSTFQQAFDQDVITQFTQANPQRDDQLRRRRVGQGPDRPAVQAGRLRRHRHADPGSRPAQVQRRAILYFPTVAAPITVSYNLSGVSKLTLSAATIAGIFSSKITTWNDPAIAADNPGVSLPSTAITPRAPLRRVGHDQQLHPVPDQGGPPDVDPRHRQDRQLAGRPGRHRATRGVAQVIKSTQGAIGYVDYSDAVATRAALRVGQERGRHGPAPRPWPAPRPPSRPPPSTPT